MQWLVVPAVVVCVVAVAASEKSEENVSEKKNVMENKVNLGWPNFFNPEKAILMKKEGLMKKKKATDGDKTSVLGDHFKSSQELLDDNRLANTVKDTDREAGKWDDITDLKIKDGLRGTLVLMGGHSNGNTGLYNEEVEEVVPADMLALIKEQLSNQTDVYQILSEVSDDKLRLATPMFRQRYTDAMGKYGVEITFFYGQHPVTFLYYGNWCGRGGRIAPVDGLDTCCLEHAKCYGRQVKRCPDVWKKPYSTMYAWTLLDDIPYCVRSESGCINSVCACDIEASLCLNNALRQRNVAARYQYNETKSGDEDDDIEEYSDEYNWEEYDSIEEEK